MNKAPSEIAERQALLALLRDADEMSVLDICRRHVLHGTPFVFQNREDEYYSFRKRIAEKFEISFHEVYITGSAKLGFSVVKNTRFDLDSDIDVAIVAPTLYGRMMDMILSYQMALRESRRAVSAQELATYHNFLEYTAMGWIRPDQLPLSFNVGAIKSDWFAFFDELSYGRSEVGDYKVSAGVFLSYRHLEHYQQSSLLRLSRSQNLKASA